MHITRRVWRTWCSAVAENRSRGRLGNDSVKRIEACLCGGSNAYSRWQLGLVKGRDHPRCCRLDVAVLLCRCPTSPRRVEPVDNGGGECLCRVHPDEVTKEIVGRWEDEEDARGGERAEKGARNETWRFSSALSRARTCRYRIGWKESSSLSTFHRFLVFHRAVVRFDGPVSTGSSKKRKTDERARRMKSSRRISIRSKNSPSISFRDVSSGDDDKGRRCIWEISIANQIKNFHSPSKILPSFT